MNELTKKNNKRALVIHFVLSIVGFVTFIILTVTIEAAAGGSSPSAFLGMLPLYLPVVLGSLIYVACAYRYLLPAGTNPLRSVRSVIILTFIGGLFFLVGSTVATIQLAINPQIESTWGLMSMIAVWFSVLTNPLGLSAATVSGVFSTHMPLSIVQVLNIILIAVIAPGLLALGLWLRQRKGDEVTSARPPMDSVQSAGELDHV
ncbi:MAG: hypothetical protein FWE46_02060 [Coriobacteriia bacterium]|nr:hypothetical protein [Coriobacteriia bacterium]